MLKDSSWEGKYDDWKLSNREDELNRTRVGGGGRYGTVAYEYMVEKLGKCPCCDEDILEDDMWTEEEDGTLLHFQCLNNKIKEEKRNGK
jgi:hypothetical protein